MSLQAHDISVSFGGVRALNGAAVRVDPGRITGLIGSNGAGKSTLVNCLTGFVRPDAGTVTIDGKDVTTVPGHRRVLEGMARTFQTPRVDTDATVEQNIGLAMYARHQTRLLGGILRTSRSRREENRTREAVKLAAERFGLGSVLDRSAAELPVWQLRLLEVARAVVMEPRYILLDEPASGLGGDELEMLASAVRGLSSAGLGVLLIEHNFGFVREIADEVVVLDRGSVLAVGTADEIAVNPSVVDSYLGATA